jgi:hypothetical protein
MSLRFDVICHFCIATENEHPHDTELGQQPGSEPPPQVIPRSYLPGVSYVLHTEGKSPTYSSSCRNLHRNNPSYRYINLLSSPKTHIVNAFSNILQATVLRPATRLAFGVIDNIGVKLTGKEQQYYVRQVPAYYRGAFNSIGEAASNALKAFKGETFTLRPDLKDIPMRRRSSLRVDVTAAHFHDSR